MRKLITILFFTLIFPAVALAWQGKIVAVENPTTFVILKDGQSPVKISLAGVKSARGIEPAKARLDSSNIALMKDVEVRELGKNDTGTILGDITIEGKSLAKELLEEGVVQSTAETSLTPIKVAEKTPAAVDETTPDPQYLQNESSEEMVSGLIPESTEESIQNKPIAAPKPTRKTSPQPQIRYVQVQTQAQPLGLWPAPPAPAVVYQPAVQSVDNHGSLVTSQQIPRSLTENDKNSSEMQKPGDISKKDYELAVRVQKKTRRTKNKGFFVPKKKSETFVGASVGAQISAKQKNTEPYSTVGAMGGASVRHFYPSGLGVGGDFFMSRTSGKSGTIGATSNATNGTSYDYKSKSFDTYTFTTSLLYRFYTDPSLTPYIALHGGYSLFSYPKTEFNLSDGAPVAGGGAGILYEFDSGFTIGADVRYLKTFGTKSHDPDGFFDSTLNFGYTFD